nr:MAG: hypothetical protein DIU68_03005 [Chloroflexota bacterium]
MTLCPGAPPSGRDGFHGQQIFPTFEARQRRPGHRSTAAAGRPVGRCLAVASVQRPERKSENAVLAIKVDPLTPDAGVVAGEPWIGCPIFEHVERLREDVMNAIVRPAVARRDQAVYCS